MSACCYRPQLYLGPLCTWDRAFAFVNASELACERKQSYRLIAFTKSALPLCNIALCSLELRVCSLSFPSVRVCSFSFEFLVWFAGERRTRGFGQTSTTHKSRGVSAC